ncbi:MAG: SDR family NAD(P)-dependent oxidoreductase [Caldilineaceae bacterium]|nr:SDR family NAD(P)-dependent oxidoreductase [Caldilineaceae bacterium]
MSSEKSASSSIQHSFRSRAGVRDVAPGGEPIAIVGMACRFPGAEDLEAFWQLLEEGQNSVSEGVPGSGVGRMGDLFGDHAVQNPACRFGAFVDGIDQFDPAFFRISPVEAELLDPQQRMMLETSWLALEDAGIDPASLSGSSTGVYTGISTDEYRMLVAESSKPAEAAGCLYALSGTNLNGASGRVSFVLGLMGPAKAVDTACASSLVSIHDAVADLQQGKADLAIAGGVNAILDGRIYELRADSMMLSPDGQCKAFDASANGYVRGEGCGVVVLKRLREAEADGDRIWAVIRGAAVNHGGTGVGLTVPNTPGLEQVMEAALEDAGVAPSEVAYVEAHGTGTAVGDPIEINAVANVYGQGRETDAPLLIGSVKTNIGHLESASGIAGLIKAALTVNLGVIPKHLHFRDPNPSLDWERLPLQVATDVRDWPNHRRQPRLAGVNSFGISGTNTHVVLEEYRGCNGVVGHAGVAPGPARPVRVSLPAPVADLPLPTEGIASRRTRFLPLSGKAKGAVRELAQRYLAWLDTQTKDLSPESAALDALWADMTWTAGVGRSHFDYRAGVVFQDVGSLREQLGAAAETGTGVEPRRATKVAFVYTGQGSQWVGMGRTLYESEPLARAILDRCEAVIQEERGASLLDVMFGRAGVEGDLSNTAWEQPALYALECALTALWSRVGIQPSVVLGHSVGELAAAQAAGVFSLEDGMRLAATRGALFADTAPGAMLAVFAPASRVAAAVAELNAASDGIGLSIAGNNGGHQVISGLAADIEAIAERFGAEGVRTVRLNTSRGFHSALLEPVLDGLEAALDGVAIEPPSLTLVSNLTGRRVESDMVLDGVYWRRHAREAVAFASGVGTLAELGIDLVIEIGPHAVLGPMLLQAWPDSMSEGDACEPPIALASLRRPRRDSSAAEPECDFIDAVAGAYRVGLEVAFEGLFAGEMRRRISLPGYPFQRERYWLNPSKRRRPGTDHPLLGTRHESARGEITFETELSSSNPSWLEDHKVFGRLVAPGALYGTMAVLAGYAEGEGALVLEEMQLHSPLVFSEKDSESSDYRTMQVVLDGSEQGGFRRVQIFSRGTEQDWTLHVEGRVASGTPLPATGDRVDLEDLTAALSPADVQAYYRAKFATGIDLGPSFRTLGLCWSSPGEALGEVFLPETLPDRNELDLHPLVLDGCFQMMGMARNITGTPEEATYLPFGWERFWLTQPLPARVFCHVQMGEASQEPGASDQPEVLTAEMLIYDPDGLLIGGFSGYTVKRATPTALLAEVAGEEGVKDLLYEVAWWDRDLESALKPADFFPAPAEVAAGMGWFSEYLTEAGVDPADRNALLTDLERWSHSYALRTLEKLGWRRVRDEVVDPDALRQRLNVIEDHKRLFLRILELLANAGVLEAGSDGFVVKVDFEDPLPEGFPPDPVEFASRMTRLYSHGLIEIGLFRRSGDALADVLRGGMDPLTLLFSSGEPTAADLYLKAPVARAANGLLADVVRTLVAQLPPERRLRVLEIGAGTGSATASVLPELPDGRFDYVYTDISAGFFAEAEARFGDGDGAIEYLALDIERDPIAQGFDAHRYDLLIASNVLHATRYLEETLGHCLALLAPSGHLVALENLRGQGWMDLTFGQLDGWWRFADSYRPHHALVGPSVWCRALGNAGFGEAEVLGVDESDASQVLDKGVIVAQGPAQITEPPGTWILAGSPDGLAAELAAELAARNQTVILASEGPSTSGEPTDAVPGIHKTVLDTMSRQAWRALIEELPDGLPFNGVVHLRSLEGHGPQATTAALAEDVKRIGASALAMVQAAAESDVIPVRGVWFVTRGAQILERERSGELAGAVLWGLGKVAALEAAQLQPRMIDLDPGASPSMADLVNELMYPDRESHIAYRRGRRQVARLVRPDAADDASGRLALPEELAWVLVPSRDGIFERPEIKSLPSRPLEPREVRIAVEATGLNFWDVFRSLGFIEEGDLGRELSGYVIEAGSEVPSVSVGDRVVGLGFGAFAPEMVTHGELVAPAPAGISASALATIPSAFVSAALSFQYSGLQPGERVLIHAGAGGVGLAAIQLAQAARAEVFATASAPKQAYLRSIGVKHVFDSRQTRFGAEILEATEGEGVHVVLNSLTSEGFIDASLSCLMPGGRFVEMARRDILSEEEMAAVRPDVSYAILELDVLKKTDPEGVGAVLQDLMARVSAGELNPLVHSRWPLAEAGAALAYMRSARHIGKIVLTTQPLVRGRLREDSTYLVTGGLGGIGCAVAEWLADQGAGIIVLNGRRDPDPEAVEAIEALRAQGVRVEVELADVTDTAALDAMMARMDAQLPPLAGVIHSVGVLSDRALSNQTWESFEQVLNPKILGAWQLHRATVDRDLDLFILFSSRVGVMGNPGQANHAAANAFLDQLAAHRRALGLAGQAMAWGAWSEIGEAAEQRERIEWRRASLGGRWFTPQQGLRALDSLVRKDATTAVIMSMDWSVFEEAVEDHPLFLEELLSTATKDDTPDTTPQEDLLAQLRRGPTAGPKDLLVPFVQQAVQAVLRLPSPPSPTVGFFDLGMDSLMSVELRNRLNRALSGAYVVSNTAVFDYPNVNSLADHLAGELGEALGTGTPEPLSAPSAPRARQSPATDDEAIAIVGMACRFPGAPDLASFWSLLESGGDAITDGRPNQGPWAGMAGDPNADDIAYRRGGFIEGLDLFDNRFFHISPIAARTMDPKQRLLLETTWQALEDAGIDPELLKGSRTGIYAGMGSSEYRDVLAAHGQADVYFGTSGSMTAGRIAYVLGLEGPAMPVDMACASSVAAVHQAAAALQRGEVDLALASGVNTILSLPLMQFHKDLGLLSEAGRCNAFDADADGFVRSEGCAVLVLKRLRQAESDGDRIWGLIRGSAINQNGASADLPVPRGPAQEQVIEDALAVAGVAPSDIDYMEAHGAGTELGDSIELRAISAVYGREREAERPLLLGSVKTNIGHTEWASGMASIIKIVMAMNRRAIPAHLHFRNPNPNFEWDRMPVRVTSEMIAWPDTNGRQSLAAVNAFGLSGSNAHVILESYAGATEAENGALWPAGSPQSVEVVLPTALQGLPLPDEKPERRKVRLLPLSGKTPEALRDMANQYLSWLVKRAEELEDEPAIERLLADTVWTAGMGRSHFPYRKGLVFQDMPDLQAKLKALSETASGEQSVRPDYGTPSVAFLYSGQGGHWMGAGQVLYRTEPAFRAVLDQCDQLLREERNTSLLDIMFGRDGGEGPSDRAWELPATYAFEAAFTALWASIGIRPDTVLGQGVGDIAAAQASGALALEDGLRLAMSLTDPDEELARITATAPDLTWISGVTGREVRSTEMLDNAYWQQLATNTSTLSSDDIDAVVAGTDLTIELGPRAKSDAMPSPTPHSDRPIVLANGGLRPDTGTGNGVLDFLEAVAAAYETGVSVAFTGLFAGEERCRIAIPGYAFQRRSFWVQSSNGLR